MDGTLVRETSEQENEPEDDEDALAGVINMDEVITVSGKFSV